MYPEIIAVLIIVWVCKWIAQWVFKVNQRQELIR
jgi:hypothetical protein